MKKKNVFFITIKLNKKINWSKNRKKLNNFGYISYWVPSGQFPFCPHEVFQTRWNGKFNRFICCQFCANFVPISATLKPFFFLWRIRMYQGNPHRSFPSFFGFKPSAFHRFLRLKTNRNWIKFTTICPWGWSVVIQAKSRPLAIRKSPKIGFPFVRFGSTR